jgi:hypothetical protein
VAIECERWQWRELFASKHGPSDPSTRLVLFVLALHMNPQGENAFPSQALIATRTGLSERSVRTHLAQAKKAGWVGITERRRAQQAWFVNEYTATIPDEVAQYCTAKPWEDDPQWKRPENSAGRQATRPAKSAARLNKSGVSDGKPSNSSGRPANGAERPAISAQRAAIDDATPGKICRDARQGLPTNSSLNSSSNPPTNSSCEGAVASDRTVCKTVLKTVSEKLKTSDRKAQRTEEESKAIAVRAAADLATQKEARVQRVRKAIAGLPTYADDEIARVTGATLHEVQQLRKPG